MLPCTIHTRCLRAAIADAAPSPARGVRAPRAPGCSSPWCSWLRLAPLGRRIRERHRRGALAQTEHAADRLAGLAHRVLAIRDIVESAGRRLVQREQIQVDQIVDVHVRPDVLTAADVHGHAVLLGQRDQPWHLDAACVDPAPGPVDQARAKHHRTHASSSRGQHGIVQRYPRGAARQRVHRRVLVVHLVAALAGREVGDDARAAGLQECLIGAGEALEDRFDRAAVVGVGRVDHRIGGARRVRQETGVLERAEQRLDAARAHLGRALTRAHQADHLMAGAKEGRRDRTSDVAGRAGDQHLHDGFPTAGPPAIFVGQRPRRAQPPTVGPPGSQLRTHPEPISLKSGGLSGPFGFLSRSGSVGFPARWRSFGASHARVRWLCAVRGFVRPAPQRSGSFGFGADAFRPRCDQDA